MIKGGIHVGISNLFEKQRQLDAEIEQKHPVMQGEDRLKNKMLALGVELGECANEQRSWKFWSTDQEPKVKVTVLADCPNCDGLLLDPVSNEECITCNASGKTVIHENNQLLEEFVDILHFVLSIGNDLNFKEHHLIGNYFQGQPDIEDAFLVVIEQLALLSKTYRMQGITGDVALNVYYALLLESFLELGNVLGFTEEQIVEAYEQKNQTNWERQAHGY